MIAVIDNYDSFTYNLVQYLGELGADVSVYRNDQISCARIPIFGVCLGLQSIGQYFGGKVVLANDIMHGKMSAVHHSGQGVFAGIPNPITCTRYHSLVLESSTLPDVLDVTAWTLNEQGERVEIMGLKHRTLDVEGVQYHPESINSEHGHAQLRGFLNRTRAAR